jgi:hypothetical protein
MLSKRGDSNSKFNGNDNEELGINLVRITLKSRTHPISETLEMPPNVSLKSLRVFLTRNFPYFAAKFLFELPSGMLINQATERSTSVASVCPLLYLRPHVHSGWLYHSHMIVDFILL